MADEYQYNSTPEFNNWNYNTETMEGPPSWLNTGNLASYFQQGAWAPYGFSGNIWEDINTSGYGGQDAQGYRDLTQDAKNWMQQNNYSLRAGQPGGETRSSSLWNNNSNKAVTSAYYNDSDPLFGALIDLGVAGVTGGVLGGGGLAGGLGMGGGVLGGAINGAAAGGLTAAGNEGNVLQGMFTGGVGGGVAGANPAGYLGVTQPALKTGINAATGSTLANLAAGKDLSSSVKAGATSGAFSAGGTAMNDFFGGLWDQYTGGNNAGYTGSPEMNASYPTSWNPGGGVGDALRSAGIGAQQSYVPPSSLAYSGGMDFLGGLPQLSGNPAANASYSADYKPVGVSALEQAGLRPEASYAAPTSPVQGDASQALFNSVVPSSGEDSTKSASSFSLPSAGQLGSFAANNAGSLAQMLYGMYNNRKQQNALSQQMASLQGLYGQNSPYASQLRAKLQAQAAQQGKRTNTDARETQLQAQLADRAASLAPSLYQMQQGQMGLQNSLFNNLINQGSKLKGLSGLFGLGD
jgi:hypothetical protein